MLQQWLGYGGTVGGGKVGGGKGGGKVDGGTGSVSSESKVILFMFVLLTVTGACIIFVLLIIFSMFIIVVKFALDSCITSPVVMFTLWLVWWSSSGVGGLQPQP